MAATAKALHIAKMLPKEYQHFKRVVDRCSYQRNCDTCQDREVCQLTQEKVERYCKQEKRTDSAGVYHRPATLKAKEWDHFVLLVDRCNEVKRCRKCSSLRICRSMYDRISEWVSRASGNDTDEADHTPYFNPCVEGDCCLGHPVGFAKDTVLTMGKPSSLL